MDRTNITVRETPLREKQRAVLGLLCNVEENGRRVSRRAFYGAVGLRDENPSANDYGLRRILGSITQRCGSSDWYLSERDANAPEERWYSLPEDWRDVVCGMLA